MYMAYGWPQVLPLHSGPPERVIFLKSINDLMLVVSSLHLEIWSSGQHKIRLGKHTRNPLSVLEEGRNLQAVWSSDTTNIVILTSSFFFHVYKITDLEKELHFGGREVSGLHPLNIKHISSKRAPFADQNLTISNFVNDNNNVLFGLSNGFLHTLTWNAELAGNVFLLSDSLLSQVRNIAVDNNTFPHIALPAGNLSNNQVEPRTTHGISYLEFSQSLRMLVVILNNGQALLCSTNKRGLRHLDNIKVERWLAVNDAVCAAVGAEQGILAIGTRRGTVDLFDVADGASLLRTVSLYDWGYSAEDTGAVSCITWTPDNCAFAVGCKLRGLTVWSTSGCRLMCTIRQIGINSIASPVQKLNQDYKYEPLVGGVSCVAWDEYGYRLYAVEQGTTERILAFPFGKCCLNRGISSATHNKQMIYAEDRVLIVQSEDNDELKIQHLVLPASYISQNWPVLHVAASKDGMFLAISGRQGLVLYDIRLQKWRVFGDVSQEQKIQSIGLLWLDKIVVICNYNKRLKIYELLFYPRYHLDKSSLLCQRSLPGRPMAMDIYESYILVAYRPFDVHVFHAHLVGELSPSNSPILQLSAVRELSIMTAKKHPVAIRFIHDHMSKEASLSKFNKRVNTNHIDHLSETLQKQPTRCLILRMNGELSLLDLDEGREHELTDSVELFWVTSDQPEGKTNLINEVSWLDYGHRGMQVWYPSPGLDPFQLQDFLQLDPELEFDREVYPLGLLPNAGVVVGVSHRISFSASSEFPCSEPTPQAQTILHCLLRHLLQRGKTDEALRLARLSANKPHFSHCLEWLLFTVFDAAISIQNTQKSSLSGSSSSGSLLLEKTCNLIRHFPEYLNVVVSVARKTDGRHWADLFAAAGSSTDLFEECFQKRWYRTAACYILVIAKLEGSAVSQYSALRLLQATLDEGMYDLAGELVRFLMRSGREYEFSTMESEKSTNKFLGDLLYGLGLPKQTVDLKSSSNKDLNAHISSVRSILERHACYLMSVKELSKLVAFVKGTHFDIVDFLKRERSGSAYLESFTSGLQVIGQKLGMEKLQNRLDAEFLLAQMCTVGFKEWIVVLATLLRRAEVLVDLFRDDMRLWNAYSNTLKSQPDFKEYNELLKSLEERLSA